MQPRTHFDEVALENLASSIRAHGIVQPILVRRHGGQYELVAGERRWRAARMAGLTTVPVVVKDIPDSNLLEIALLENIQREDLNPIEEAQAYRRLIENVGLTQDALASRVGRDRSYITNYLRLLKLSDDLQQLVIEGRLSTGHARTLLALPHIDMQRRVARQVLDGALSVRATEAIVQRLLERKPKQESSPTSKSVDPNIRAAETKLRRALGTHVRIIQHAPDGPGKIEISFFNTQDLDRVYTLISSSL
jgi:ParB family chromosome partitioning protein